MKKTNYSDFYEVVSKIDELESMSNEAMAKSDEVIRWAIKDCQFIYSIIDDFLCTESKCGFNTETSHDKIERIKRVCKKLLQAHLINNYNKDSDLIFPVCTDDRKTQYVKKDMGAVVYFEHHNLMGQYVRITEYGFTGGGCKWNRRGVSLLLKDRRKTPKLLTKKICRKNHVVCDIDYEDFLMSDVSI